jgi:hypothetical protein
MKPLNRLPAGLSPKKPGIAKPLVGMLGLGLDNDDEINRITRGENFLLLGGSQETHERMQETTIKVNEELGRRGKRLEDISPRELFDILNKAVG